MISSSPLPPRAVLTVLNSAGSPAPQGQTQITQFPFVIGRVEGSLVIPEANVSRRHAQINYSEASRTFTITDLNSSNGTRLNNQPLVSGQPNQIASGSVIGLGPNVTLRFDLI
jgi:pSer/pThr/pTyr-binding forkhead associated (FHA) protein